MDYEKPYIPDSWQQWADAWAARLGLGDKEVRLICSTERFGAPVILRLVGKGPKVPFTRRSSDVANAAKRRDQFIQMASNKQFDAVEIDMTGHFVEEALVAPAGSRARTQWQPAVLRELLRVADPTPDVPGEGEAADHAEDELRDKRVQELLSSADAPKA
ncbi:MAG TPA: hypothetical protein VFC93_06555 [Chloroflexota bacterium]|nr:hypothetical protein [Chloroflexota bacterium]